MIGIIIVGHGHFSKGVASTIEMIAGKQQNLLPIAFTEEVSPESLIMQINDGIDAMNAEGIIIFTDLLGGTPFQCAARIASQHNHIEVIAGTNIAMLLEAVIARNAGSDVNELAKKLITTGQEQIVRFELVDQQFEQEMDDDGI